MSEKETLTFPSMFGRIVEKFGESGALSFVGQEALTYRQVLERVKAVTAQLEKAGIRHGDRVGILSTNMPNWGIAYFGISFMGAVVVPLLPDFTPAEIGNILNHSEARVIFVSSGLRNRIENAGAGRLEQIIRIEDFSPEKAGGPAFDPAAIPAEDYGVGEEDLAAIIYTSGTTGSSKGVMLTHRNICSNVVASRKLHPVDENDRFMSILPLSHTLENTVGFMIPMMNGASVYYLEKPPSPSVLTHAMRQVRPTIMLAVPMVIEKIYFQRIKPRFEQSTLLRSAMKFTSLRKILHRSAGRKLMKTFGGELEFFGIGGAKLNTEVEKFLMEAGFPYAIGYGLTETSPLLAGAVVGSTRIGSTGPPVEGVELKIHEPNPETGEGEIWAKGPNVMKGYYREEELTAGVLVEEGWFRTGDLGTFDEDGYLYIRGRLKNMIVGSSGENIYPEEIEFVINNFRHVVESLVIEKKGKLVAKVHLNMEEIEQAYRHLVDGVSNFMEEKVEEVLNEIKVHVNQRVNKFSRVHSVELQPVPFQKTATQKIKRFLYS